MWYVVVNEHCCDPQPHERVWTVSRDPNETGWETDCGYNGYGLTKADAEELANAANESKRLREALKKIADIEHEDIPAPKTPNERITWTTLAVAVGIAEKALKND